MNSVRKILYRQLFPERHESIIIAGKNQWLSKEELLEFQERKLRELIDFVTRSNTYYHKLGIENIKTLSDLSGFPCLTKDLIRNNIEDIKASNVKPDRFIKNSTSGSTGSTLRFYSDSGIQYSIGCKVRGDSWSGWRPWQSRIILWGAAQDFKQSLKKRIKSSSLLLNEKIISSFEMNDDIIRSYIELINRKKPSLIVGYPSSLSALSGYAKDNNIHLWNPTSIITSGETLYEPQRELISSVFSAPVFNRYGCREIGQIASECECRNGLHLSSDHVIVEMINEKGEKCREGELGELVITDLDNYVFPFIRYKIGDIGVYTNRMCSCGRGLPLLERVEGRTFDLIIGTNGNRIPGNFFTLLRYKIEGIKQFQVHQPAIGKINIRLVVNNLFDAGQQGKITRLVQEKTGTETMVNIEIVESIPQMKSSGKFRWVKSDVSPFKS